MKEYNTMGTCIPSKHYMVDISDKVAEIKELVDDGKYFSIDRGRQYGKTTTLVALHQALQEQYVVISLDFRNIDDSCFKNSGEFSKAFANLLLYSSEFDCLALPENIKEMLHALNERKTQDVKMDELFRVLRKWFIESSKPIVLIIDEVDSATINQVFMDFLAQLRSLYLKRVRNPKVRTFQSVIFAGVTDVRRLRSGIRDEDSHKVNGPWNIAADFDIDMSLSEAGIMGMLDEYEADHQTGMDTGSIARMIREYTNGYPFLVSRICQLIDRKLVPEAFPTLPKAWTAAGVEKAVNMIVRESNTLFESLMGKIQNYDGFRNRLQSMLFKGESIDYYPDNYEQGQLMMYGFIMTDGQKVRIANRIFEMRILRYLIGESAFSSEMSREAETHKPEFIKGGQLDAPLIMTRFIDSQKIIRNIYDEEAEKKFIEDEGREKFLTYISPILNGVGTYSVEDRSANGSGMDVVIHYNGRRYVIELKIWHGERYNEDGEQQITDYLDRFNLREGYMLSFSFNKNKKPGVNQVWFGDKLLHEGIV